jgi:AcrR family transcriptional regulator
MLGTPKRNRITERREAMRLEILEAAWEVAREVGISAVTLSAVAARVGMQAPSLYTHFASKNTIYDAMFGQAWSSAVEAMPPPDDLPEHPRERLRAVAGWFFDFSVADLARFQLMNQRAIPDFTPSTEAYAPSIECWQALVDLMAGLGVHDLADVDLYAALLGGLVDSQLANDPGGDRYARLLDRAVHMYADEVGLPGPREESP